MSSVRHVGHQHKELKNMDNDKKSGDDDAAPFSGAATTGTAAPSPAGAHDEEVRRCERTRAD